MTSSRFDKLLKMVESGNEESCHDNQNGVVSSWYRDLDSPAGRLYKVNYDSEDGEAFSVQRCGTTRTFYKQDDS
jgi:hypothetical protein